ncbi:spermidine/putrescine ABC transporter substrate-binding protein [Actinosynnema pretiosum subsp. pretiosum]|uniref:Extracellular solute-binding protein family 1 n=2 Tax=Actinosynnema TaxID=40566 RepID=C6WET1_ACTMD|nr:spermidine/putrescine ABC transporter substrate-binding protein [Actinosynnema mirum]ACU39706.1 extracellular solute-binding protein family 1 [Actinosynnema mirum DSM 43827]QUF02951.1 spermidine/putrescine ABC transporter substrate-binding protein [Actinosynnema pretiosum subsp. pretiosum]
MTDQNLRIARIWDPGNARVTRRSMFRASAFFALAATGACGVGQAPGGSTSSAPSAAKATNAVDEPKLNFYNWTDYIADDTLSGFTEASGVQVTYDNFSTNDELEAKIASGAAGYDLVVPSDNFLRRFLRSDLVLPLDHDLIPNLKNLETRFTEADYDAGNRYSVPWAWGTTGLAYSKSQLGDAVTGFSAYDLAAAQGRSTILDEARDALALGLLKLGFDPNTTDAGQIDQAATALLELKRKIGQINSDVIEPLTSGQVPLAQSYSGDAFQAREANEDIAYAIPTEGGLSYVDLLCIPKQAPHAANAHAFINYILEPKVGAALANAVRYGSPNAAAKEFIEPELLDDPLVYPSEEQLAKLPFTKDLGAEAEARYADAWTKVKTG